MKKLTLKKTVLCAKPSLFDFDARYAKFIENPTECLKPLVVLGDSEQECNDTEDKVIAAVNNTYGKNINPEGIEELIELLDRAHKALVKLTSPSMAYKPLRQDIA